MDFGLGRATTVFIALIACCTVAAAGLRAAPAQATQAGITVTASPTTGALAADFLGLALEYNTIPEWVDSGPGPVNPVLVKLIRNLDPTGRPEIRIGGQSTDRTWWPVNGLSRPLGVTYALTPAWTGLAHALAQAIDGNLLLGINLEANRTRISQTEADELLKGIGSTYIGALEIGNEPNLYPLIPWYKLVNGKPAPWYDPAGAPVFSRLSSYGPPQFAQELTRTLKVMPRVAIAGPEASPAPLVDIFSHLLAGRSPVRMLTTHAYGLNQCVQDPASSQYPSVPNLLKLSASRNLLSGVTPYVRIAHRSGATFRIDEMGSVTCNGRPGVSNTMASALWVLDALFAVAGQGVDGVNLHTYPKSDNGLFDLARSHGRWTATAHPLYYGALMFAQAAPAGSRLLRVLAASSNGIRAWATLGADHRVRVLVINDGLTSAALAQVHAPPGYGASSASIERLRAPSAYATGDVTLGGKGFGRITSSGTLASTMPDTATPRGGAYAVALPPASAALLTLSRP